MSELTTPRRSVLASLVQSTGFRAIIIALFVLLMLIPSFMVSEVVQERQSYHERMLDEVASTWGGKQTLVGPILVIPYVEHFTSVDTVTDKDGESRVVSKDIYNDRTLLLLPDDLDVRADLKEEHRQRGIYDALVYTANISLTGKFDYEFLVQDSKESERRILWDKAFIMVGISDTKALDSSVNFQLDKDHITLEPGTRMTDLVPTGFHAPLSSNDSTATAHDFKLTLNLRGSDGLFFAPLGKNTKARMTSTWTNPSFQGNLLPKKHELSEQGFNAEWEIPHLARNYPQHWILQDKQTYDLQSATAGVSLYEPVSLYSQVVRASKYAVLFIGLTFLVFFGFEISLKQRLHSLQYALIGGALALFYLILLALAEHIAFLYAYTSAAATVIVLITLYSSALLPSKWRVFGIFLLLTALYSMLYLLLQMEDYALLAGVGVLVMATGFMMIVTRHLQKEGC